MYPGSANDRQQFVMAGILALLAFMLLSGAAYGDCMGTRSLSGTLSATPEPDVENCLSWIRMGNAGAAQKATTYEKTCDAQPGCTAQNTRCGFEPTGKDGEYRWTLVLKCEERAQAMRLVPDDAPKAEWAVK